jgi:outer membrane protein assembly factor BamB
MYEIDLTSIRFTNGKRFVFSGEIAEILDFEGSVVVRLDENRTTVIQNIYGLDYKGNLLWQLPCPVSFCAANPYVRVSRNGGFVDAVNWDGHVLTVHPKAGRILREDFCSNDTFSTRRRPSVRQWL